MDTYFGLQEDTSCQHKTMQDRLCQILANKREKIARAHIQTYMGTDAHDFSSYMANMGTLLAIPGTENTIEYLTGRSFNKPLMLRHFFSEYTPKCIRQTVQEEIKNSQAFREMLFDWLQSRVADWKKDAYNQKITALMQRMQPPNHEKGFYKKIEAFLQLVEKAKQATLPDPKEDFEAFLDALFTLDSTKKAYTIFDRHNLKTALKNECIKDALVQACTNPKKAQKGLQEGLQKVLQEKAAILDNVQAINQSLCESEFPALDDAVLIRCQKNKEDLKQILLDHVDKIRQSEFLEALTKNDEQSEQEAAIIVEKKGVKPSVLDWILISNNILVCT